MARGRPATPTALRVLRGNPGRRPLPKEPALEPATSDAPADLPKEARAIWDALAPAMVAAGILTVLDRTELAKACRFQALCNRWLALAEVSTTKKRPPAAILPALRCGERASAIFSRYGMTPSDRAKLGASPHAHRDPLEAYRQAKPARRA